jgi:FOG: PKD repeat
VPLAVGFTDTTTGDVSSRTRDFGDGGTSDEQNPVRTYVINGIHTVTLTVIGPGGNDTAPRTPAATVP